MKTNHGRIVMRATKLMADRRTKRARTRRAAKSTAIAAQEA